MLTRPGRRPQAVPTAAATSEPRAGLAGGERPRASRVSGLAAHRRRGHRPSADPQTLIAGWVPAAPPAGPAAWARCSASRCVVCDVGHWRQLQSGRGGGGGECGSGHAGHVTCPVPDRGRAQHSPPPQKGVGRLHGPRKGLDPGPGPAPRTPQREGPGPTAARPECLAKPMRGLSAPSARRPCARQSPGLRGRKRQQVHSPRNVEARSQKTRCGKLGRAA